MKKEPKELAFKPPVITREECLLAGAILSQIPVGQLGSGKARQLLDLLDKLQEAVNEPENDS